MPVTNYIWDEVNDTVLMETDGSGNTTAVYTHEPGQFGGLISERRGNQSRYYHYDGLGSTRALTDQAGNVTDTYLYDAYGNTVQSTGTTMVPYHFIGRSGYYHDQELADYYVRARHYSPALARWLSQDPMGYAPYYQAELGRFVEHDPIGYTTRDRHLFRYAGDNPVTRVDPSGTRWWPELGIPFFETRMGDAEIRWCRPCPCTDDQAAAERASIIQSSREWFGTYFSRGHTGWPNENCEDQVVSLAWDIGRRKCWDIRGVKGWRWNALWPSGEWRPKFREWENALGILPKPGCKYRGFVVDGFHGYNNQETDVTIYDTVADFFRDFPYGASIDTW